MKVFVTILLVFVLAISMAWADQVDSDPCYGGYWRPPKMHWAQGPDLTDTGVSQSFSEGALADDFVCNETGPIGHIHLWVSLADDMVSNSAEDSLSFQLSIYSGQKQFESGPISYWRSTDGGASFTTGQIAGDIQADSAQQVNPAIAVDNQGIIHAVWENYKHGSATGDIYYMHWGEGTDAAQPVRVIDAGGIKSHQAYPDIAVGDDDVIHIVWEDFRDDNMKGNIYYAQSRDGGATFTLNIMVDDQVTMTSHQGKPAIAVDKNGVVHVVWEDFRDNPKLAGIAYTKSTDGGLTFGQDVMIGGAQAVTSHQGNPDVAISDNGVIHVVWEDYRDDPVLGNIYYASSGGGTTDFSEAIMVDESFTTTSHQANPSIAVDNTGIVHVAWEDYRDNPELGNIYYANSINNFKENWMVDDRITDTSHQAKPIIAVDGTGTVYVAWADYRDNPEMGVVYFSKSTDQGKTFGPDVRVGAPTGSKNQVGRPAMAVDTQGVIHVVSATSQGSDSGTSSLNRPGEMLWTQSFGPGQYIVQGAGSQTSQERTYHYDFCTDENPFVLQEGEVYWLEVKSSQADVGGPNTPDSAYSSGWRTTPLGSRWNWGAMVLDSQGRWLPLSYPKGHPYAGEPLDLAFVITGAEDMPANSDLGDAPDSSNSFPGTSMTAYPQTGAEAHFPTVYELGSPPYGPLHRAPRQAYYLGAGVSLEGEADLWRDEDSANNLDVPADEPDLDGLDDGVQMPLSLPHDKRVRFDYVVTVVNPPGFQYFYVNVWFDWNRDGDWDDTIVNSDGIAIPEWAVQNEELYLYETGTFTFTTPYFRCWHPFEGVDPGPLWMRITLSEQEPPRWSSTSAVGHAGAGPINGYDYGETEDYYIYP